MKHLKLLLVVSPVYMAQFDLKNSIVYFIDGSMSPKKLAVKVGDGNITFNETKVRKYVLDRGRLSQVTNGDETPIDVTIDLIWEELQADVHTSGVPTPEDALKKRGNAAGWVSSDSDVCAPYAVDVEIYYNPACTTIKIEQIVLPDFRYEKLDHDAKSAMLKCSGKCNATEASITRIAHS